MSGWTDAEREEFLNRRKEAAGASVAGFNTTGMLSSFISTGESKVAEGGSLVDDFLEAEEYNGFKDGYIFKRSKWGTGYYADKGPFGPVDDYDVNAGMVVTKVPEYDMDAHARGESVVEPPKEPGHGRVGALGDLLAENKQKKQDEFEALVHANRFQPPKGYDDDEVDFLNEKAAEKREQERLRKAHEQQAELEYRLAMASAGFQKDSEVDLAKLMGQSKAKKPNTIKPSILSRMVVKRKGDSVAEEGKNKVAKTEPEPAAPEADVSASLLGLDGYGDSDEDD